MYFLLELFKILLCQKITVEISSLHCSSQAKDKSNVYCVFNELSLRCKCSVFL